MNREALKNIVKRILKEELAAAAVGTGIGGDSIHILNDSNATIGERNVEGFPYKCLQLNLQQDLSSGDIDKLINELKAFKEQLEKLNTPPQNQ